MNFQSKLTFFWNDLLSHLKIDSEDYEGRRGVSYSVSYLKRQAMVANEIARYRSQSENEIFELAEREIQLIKIYSNKRSSASLPK